MPQATNIVVKNAASIDKTFTLNSPAPGYGQPADWALREGATSVAYPVFSLSAMKNSASRARKVTLKTRVPAVYTSVATGLPVVSSYMEFNGTVTVPDDFPDNQKDDAVAYIVNLLGVAQVKAAMRDGLPLN